MSLRIDLLAPGQELVWDAYVCAHPHGTPFHLLAWKRTIEATFAYQSRYLCAYRPDGSLRGILPLFLVDTFLTGKVLLSTPFAVYGGILAEDDQARDALGQHLRTMAESEAVQYLFVEFANHLQFVGEIGGAIHVRVNDRLQRVGRFSHGRNYDDQLFTLILGKNRGHIAHRIRILD